MNEEEKPALPMVPANCGPQTISLSVLLEFAIQQIFHEITVLSELLTKKQESDRKISLVQFAHSTRMLFVKLQALVKWVKSSRKFEACTNISSMLEQNAQYFVDTADRLVALSREELVLARLPAFQVSSAVDVLTQGTFSRLPLCIKERFIKEKKISPKDQAQVLHRLNQVLQYRVSRVASRLSPRITDIRIKNGIVTLVVPGEFQVQLTVLGETENTKWTLLNIKMLVEDYEIGYGTQLVHPLQLNMLHNVLQSRMNVSLNPLGDVYSFLHMFAQNLQLDVLFCQASQLSAGRLRQKIIMEKYDAKERVLTVGYWVQKVAQRRGSSQIRLVPQYRLTIYGDCENDEPLKVRHFPNAPNLGQLDARTGRLSFDRLLSETLAVRCRERLQRIRKRLEAAEPKAVVALTGQAAPCISFPLLRDSVENDKEYLVVSVNMFTGRVLCRLSSIEQSSRAQLNELAKSLYDSHPVDALRKQLDRLKVLLMIERYRRSVSTLQVRIVNEAQMAALFKKVSSLSEDRICLQFVRQEHYYLVVTFTADEQLSVQMGLFLISTTDDKVQLMELGQDLPQLAAPLDRVIKLESNTYGETADYDGWSPKIKRRRVVALRMEQQLCHAVAAVDDRLSFMKVCIELDKKNIRYKTIEKEPHVGGLVLHLTELAHVLDIKCPEFLRNLVRCCIRLDHRSRVQWPFECCIVNSPLPRDIRGIHASSVTSWIQDLPITMHSSRENIADTIIDHLTRYTHIFEIVNKFARAYKAHYYQYCNVIAYTYHKLVLAYGANRDQLIVVTFNAKEKNPLDRFKLTFGQTLPRKAEDPSQLNWELDTRWNAHCMMTPLLSSKFNKDLNLVELVHYLVSTTVPLHAMSAFSRIRFQSCKVIAQMLNIDVPYPIKLKCHMVAVNEHTVRLTFGDVHLEVAMLENNQVAVRDSSRSKPRAAGLHQFFMLLSGGTAQLADHPTMGGLFENQQHQQHMDSKSPNHLHHTAPLSLPSRSMLGTSPANTNLLSAPPHFDSSSPMDASQPRPVLSASGQPIVLSHETLVKACKFEDTGCSDGILRSPMDDYLSALSFIQRLYACFDMQRRGLTPSALGGNGLIRELTSDLDHVRVVIPSVCPPGMAVPHSPCNITFLYHLDPNTLQIRLRVTYASDNPPADSDIALIVKYFEQVVFRANNELAVMAFMQLCRLTPHGAVGNIAQIMQLQMEPSAYNALTMNLQLVYLARDSNNPLRRFGCGVITEINTNANILMLVAFRPVRPTDRADKQIVKLFYNIAANSVKQQGTEDESITPILASASAEVARTGECPLLSAVRQLVERPSLSSSMVGSVGQMGLPPSVGPLLPPGSVGPMPPGSVGHAHSVGQPVSVGQLGSVHNPGSMMMNPGSNAGL